MYRIAASLSGVPSTTAPVPVRDLRVKEKPREEDSLDSLDGMHKEENSTLISLKFQQQTESVRKSGDVSHITQQAIKTMPLTPAPTPTPGSSFMADIKIDYFPPILKGACKIHTVVIGWLG